MAPAVGQKAPDFSLVDTDRKPRSLAEFKGKKVILAFYPAAFTGVCTKEMCTFRDSLGDLANLDAAVLGISVDTPFANKAFAEQYKINFPLLSDYARDVISAYNIQFPDLAGLKGYTAAKRAIFVLDKEGVIRYAWVSDDPLKEPNYDEVTQAAQQIA
ncbi:MAG: peroxiredoxin [Candidatus Methylomirabilales bacterium]